MRKVTKIAIYSKDFGVGGIQRSLMNVLDVIDDDNYEIDLFLFSKVDFFAHKLPANVNVHYFDQNNTLSRFVPLGLYTLFTRNDNMKVYDYAVDFDGFLNKQTAMTLKTKARSRIIWVHTDIYRLYRYYRDRPLGMMFYLLMHLAGRNRWRKFDTVVGVSDPILTPLRKRFNNPEYLVIPNGIDAKNVIKKSEEKPDVLFDSSKYNVLSVGRLSPQKNYPNTIKELAPILKSRNDLHYYIVGDGIDRGVTESYIDRYGVREKVTLLGATNNPYVYYKQADGFILNSKLEGQGLVLMEAKIFDLDLFYPEHLSPVISNLADERIDISQLRNVSKNTNKKLDDLAEYNDSISKDIRRLFSGSREVND